MKKISIIIQGPLTYYKEIISNYKNVPNVLISTSITEPIEHINALLNNNFIVTVTNMLPETSSNINKQCTSSTMGLCRAKLLGTTHALKIRSDMFVSDLDKFIFILSQKSKLSFLCWHRDGYLVDYLNYGKIDEMIEFWSVENTELPQIPEKILLNNFIKNKNITSDAFETIKTSVDFILDDIHKSNIHIKWIKYGINVSEYINYPTVYLY